MKPASLDELIAKKAEEFADQVRAAAAIADKEEEIRIEVEKQLAFVQKEAGVKLQGKHEFTVASGRVDSVYNAVIIEYKNPSSPSARIGPGANSPGAKKVVDQIKSRFYDMRSKETLNTLFGVGCDGKHFIFVRYYNDKWQPQDPVEVNKHSAERFLWALFNLGTKGKRFEPDYLAGDFGSAEGSVASAGIKVLYDAIRATDNPKATTFFSQWKILFGEVCGYDVDNPSDKIKKLADSYGVPAKGVKPAEMLFAVHTYYALFMKLLAGEIISHFHKLPSQIGKIVAAPSATKLKHELGELEAGGIFRHLGITNFLEGDLFAWYLPAWSADIEDLIRKMTARLDQYNPGTLAEEPAESRDMLKKLYQQLFPKSVRHDLGEYYTPDWLAEHVPNELGYVGDPDKRLLDPACGSGTFLVMAITRIRAWYEANREKLPYDEGELCKKILANVVGFDLNPLAVMAARTNYLIAIRDLVSHVDKVEIPVYLCDSILTPSTYGGLFAGSTTAAKELKTSAAKFLIPVEIATNADDVAKYTEQLEFCVRNAYQPSEFVQKCKDEGLPVTLESLHVDLYKELVQLDKANKNGVWARIIKNAFAPLFVGRVDFVAGNPPWVLWDNLPAEFRESLRVLMTDDYRLMAKRQSSFTRLGQAKKDLSMVFFYAGLDKYCTRNGRLGFVITQTVFQTRAGDEFREFRLPDGTPIKVFRVEDWVAVEPFRPKAGNKTATVFASVGEKTAYPVPYIAYTPEADFDREAAALDEVLAKCNRADNWAQPSDATTPCSFWTVSTKKGANSSSDHSMTIGSARAGISTALESAYKVEILSVPRKGEVLIQNIIKGAKKPLPQRTAAVEAALVYPFVSGESVKRWHYELEAYYIVPHTRETGIRPIPEGEMRRSYPRTYSYLRAIKDELETRTLHARWGKNNPFYSLYNIGDYTFAPYRLCWKRTTKNFAAAVISTLDDTHLGRKLVLANNKVMLLPFEDHDLAHFVCGIVNSPGARKRINASITTEAHAEIISVVQIPKFSPRDPVHKEICALSVRAHDLAPSDSGEEALDEVEVELENAVRRLSR